MRKITEPVQLKGLALLTHHDSSNKKSCPEYGFLNMFNILHFCPSARL